MSLRPPPASLPSGASTSVDVPVVSEDADAIVSFRVRGGDVAVGEARLLAPDPDAATPYPWVVLVVGDALRADALLDPALSRGAPALRAFASAGRLFTNAVTAGCEGTLRHVGGSAPHAWLARRRATPASAAASAANGRSSSGSSGSNTSGCRSRNPVSVAPVWNSGLRSTWVSRSRLVTTPCSRAPASAAARARVASRRLGAHAITFASSGS